MPKRRLTVQDLDIHRTYDSLADIGDTLARYEREDIRPKGNGCASGSERDRDWAPHTLKQTIKILQSGGIDPKSDLPMLAPVNIDSALEARMGKRPEMESAVVGFAPNVPAMLSHATPQTMFHLEQQDRPASVVRIGVSYMRACNITSGQIYRMGLALVSVIEALIMREYNVELWAIGRIDGQVSGSSRRFLTGHDILLKPADGFWSPESVSFVFTDASFLRRAWFRLLEAEEGPKIRDMTNGGYGGPTLPVPADDLDVYIGSTVDMDAYGGYSNDPHDKLAQDAARDWMVNAIVSNLPR